MLHFFSFVSAFCSETDDFPFFVCVTLDVLWNCGAHLLPCNTESGENSTPTRQTVISHRTIRKLIRFENIENIACSSLSAESSLLIVYQARSAEKEV